MRQILSTRSLRTFVLRQGRLTAGQQKNLDDYWPGFGIEINDAPIDLSDHFDIRNVPLWCEIGFGNGESLVAMAAANPEINFVGVEVHLPGVGHVLGEIAARQLKNVRIIRYDAVELLEKFLPDHIFERVLLFFPDPWHKKRHHKRRIVNAEFLMLLRRVLVADGVFHTATDWESYARHIEAALAACDYFLPLEDASSIIADRPLTKFEERGLRLGHEVTDLVYRLVGS